MMAIMCTEERDDDRDEIVEDLNAILNAMKT